MSGLAQSYAQLLAARAALGVGESTTVPAGVSLLGDHPAKPDRGRAAGVQAALQVGLAVGLIGGGVLAARLGWRPVFFLATAPGAALAYPAFLASRRPAQPRFASLSSHRPTTRDQNSGWGLNPSRV